MSTVIKVENLSKQYQLGQVGTGTMSHDVNRWWHRVRGKEDPYLKIGDENDRTKKATSEFVWALKDINFEVKDGEVLGIIGRNGAGKSTLLKILSRTTAPTTGQIKIKGRVASLLEVGTGFHPELSGRDNIFLNGAILGMTKAEIKRKFDEIVDFAGVERYIDTPVKRYSSGMYVRLAFGVAAHLEPEILIVDEVLAVGDAEFQKKCLGKMKDVSVNDGRTVLFVSHNLSAMKKLCDRGILLTHGKVDKEGTIHSVIDYYSAGETPLQNGPFLKRNILALPKNTAGYFTEWQLENGVNKFSDYTRELFRFVFEFETLKSLEKAEIGFLLRDMNGEIIYGCNNRDNGGEYLVLKEGSFQFTFNVRLPVKSGRYEIDITLVDDGKIIDQWIAPDNLVVLNKFDSVLPENWQGILQELPSFEYDKKL